MINCFLSCGCDGEVLLPALPESYTSELPPLLSQVYGLLILPKGAQYPADWTSSSDIQDIINNSTSTNSAGKWLVGRGSIPKPRDVIINTGKTCKQVAHRIYTLNFEVNIRCDEIYAFLKTLQRNYTAFDFWFSIVGGRFIGGPKGIKPNFVTAWTEYSEDPKGLERGFVQIEWFADGDPLRSSSGATEPFSQPMTVLESDSGSVLMDDSGRVLGFFNLMT